MSSEQLTKAWRLKRMQTWMIVAGIAIVAAWSGIQTEFSIAETVAGFGELVRYLFTEFLPPDMTALPSLLGPALETLSISFVAMVAGSLISMVFAFLAAATTAPHPGVQVAVRSLAAILRNIPTLIWAVLLVSAYGLGPLVGVLALVLTSVGTLTRAFAEVLEEIDKGQLEAVRATGAGYFQVLGQAVFPQFLPGFIGWSLFKLEINVRSSAIIGMVGGGGLGFSIQTGLKLFQFTEVSMAILLVLVLVICTEFVTSRIRERLL